METIWIKILLMPIVIALVTLASKKWGNNIGGIIASLPWVAGPIIVFIAIEQGTKFAIETIPGVLIGIIGWLVFSFVYVLAGIRYNAVISVIFGYISYILLGILLKPIASFLDINVWFVISLILLSFGLRYFPRIQKTESHMNKKLRFEIPLRMLMITIFVLVITYFAKILGPSWSGILTPFPIMTAVLAIFTHHTQGIYQVRKVFIGLFTGMFGFTLFLFLQAIFLSEFGIFISFLIGLLADIILTVMLKYLFEKFQFSI